MTGYLQEIDYAGWQSWQLSNGIIDLVIPQKIGIRIIRLGFIDAPNLFYEVSGQQGKTGGDTWRLYGGHRLWHAPEAKPRTYQPDNRPITLEEHLDFIRLIQPEEQATGIIKEIDIHLFSDSARVKVVHRLRNAGAWTITCAPWALSVLNSGSRAIVPLPGRRSHSEQVLPSNTLTLWAYTNMADPRWTWGERYVMLQQQVQMSPQKLGIDVHDNWSAAIVNETLLVKQFEKKLNATYPDMGSVVEIFTDEHFLELETCGALQALAPGQAIEHTESWFLFPDVPVPDDETMIERVVLPRIKQIFN